MKKKHLVLGLGISGIGAARLLLKKGKTVLGYDDHNKVLIDHKNFSLTDSDIDFENIAKVIISPGFTQDHPIVKQAKNKRIEIIGEIELGLRYLKNKCIGITGTNGKSTCCSLITHVLNQNGIPAVAVGNIGKSLCEYLISCDEKQLFILELSSFQLETMSSNKLDIAVIINISEDHLNRYLTMENYVKAKMQIQMCMKNKATLYVSKEVEKTYSQYLDSDKQIISFSPLGRISETNYLAYLVCLQLGIDKKSFDIAYTSFPYLRHRLECIADVNDIEIYNDSKATNIASVAFAVGRFNRPIVLLVGGLDKGGSYLLWKNFSSKVKKMIAFGSARDRIFSELKDFFEIDTCKTMQNGVDMAIRYATSGDVILFSPGCASFDQFMNFEKRGEAFKSAILDKEIL